jgi:phospholipid/cholesterol/gamma-HCH transport system substrate-binding protein
MAQRTRTSHLNQRVSGVAAKLDDHRLLLGLLVAAVGAFLAYVAFVSTTGPPFQSKYQVKVEVPADAPPVRVGQAVRIGGKLAGLISDVEPDREHGGTLVTANITKTEFRPIGEDATARVTVHSIVYATYLELYPGNTDEPMPDGGTITQEHVDSGVDLLEVVQLFDEQARESLRTTVVNVGFGLAGRGDGLNQAFATSEPTAADLNAQLSAVNEDDGALGEALVGAAATSSGLEGVRDDDISATIGSGAAVGSALAARRTELAEAIVQLRPFEDQLLESAPVAEPLFADLESTSRELEPVVHGLNAALPDVNTLLGLGPTLETESGRITTQVNPVLETTRPIVRHIYPIVAALNPLEPDVDRVVAGIRPYKKDIKLAGTGLAEATSTRFPQGRGVAAGAPMGRVIPVFTCHANRNPFPGPGEGLKDAGPC